MSQQSAYIFVVILFAAFLGTVIVSNLLALLTAGVLRFLAARKSKQL